MGSSIVIALQLALFLLIALGAFLVVARRDRRAKAGDRRRSSRGGRPPARPAGAREPACAAAPGQPARARDAQSTTDKRVHTPVCPPGERRGRARTDTNEKKKTRRNSTAHRPQWEEKTRTGFVVRPPLPA